MQPVRVATGRASIAQIATLSALVAFLARITHAVAISRTPFFAGPIIDAFTYRELAKQIAAGGGYGGAFYQPPLYPAILGQLLRVGLGSPWAIAIVQSVVGAISVALLVSIADSLFTKEPTPEPTEEQDARRAQIAWTTGLAGALYGPLILFDLELLPPVFVHVALLGALALVLRAGPKLSFREPLAGLLIGIATTGWALSAVLGLGIGVLRALRVRKLRPIALGAVLAIAAAAIPIGMVAKHNADQGAPNVIISWNGGINLWLGNGVHWRDTWRARPGARFEPELERPDREGVTKAGARTGYYVELALRDAAARPGAAVLRTLEKLYYAWHGREIRRNQDNELLREASPLLALLQWEHGLMFPFGLLAPLALFSLWRRRREADARVIFATTLLYSIALSILFIADRYRLPMALLLLPFAAEQAVVWWKERRVTRAHAAAFLLLFVGLNAPNAFTASFRADEAERLTLESRSWRSQGNLPRAREVAERAVSKFPEDANVQMLAAETYMATNRCDLAVPHLRRALELAPETSGPATSLGQCLDGMGDVTGAERAYAHALAVHPFHPQALRGAAVMYSGSGRAREAEAMFRRFRRAGYYDPNVEFDYGRLLVDAGRADEGLAVLEPLLRKRPGDDELRHLVERARAQR